MIHLPKKTAEKLIHRFKTNNPYEIASHMNVHVVEWSLHDEINGYYKYDKRNQYIVINSNLNDSYKRFVCAHELGHSQLHERVNTPFLRNNTLFSTNKIEVEANTFAVELLMPDEYIYTYSNSNMTINDVSVMYGVPMEVSHLKKI